MAEIPIDLRAYLENENNRTLHLSEGEVREVSLYGPDDLPARSFTVDTYDFYLAGEFEEDPDKRFECEGVDLVQSCGSYSPEGILIWFPTLKAYGSWDPDHLKIMLFPNASWADIVREPTWFFNGQWYPEKVGHEYLRPWLEGAA